MNNPALALDQAEKFIGTIAEKTACTFQTFDDSKQKRGQLVSVLHGTLAEKWQDLEALNEKGAGIFVTVNQTDLKGRSAENVTALRALFVDADDVRMGTFGLPPNIIVMRSEIRWHAYWLLHPGESLADFEKGQVQLQKFYHTDTVKDLPRVMRIPGFIHRKEKPLAVDMPVCNPSPRYTIAEIIKAHPVAEISLVKPPAPPSSGNGNEKLFRAWAAAVAKDMVVDKNRNTKTFQIACEGHGRGISQTEVEAVCLYHSEGLTEYEVKETVKNAFSKERTGNAPVVAHTPTPTTPVVVPQKAEDDGGWSISELLAYDVTRDDNALLGRRYLCKGGGMMFFGATGRGKSSALMQMAITWSLGLPFFGITPAKPLKSIIIQAENDKGDASEMIRGVLNGMDLIDRESEVNRMVRIYRQCAYTQKDFAAYFKALVLLNKPDLGFIDPLFAYLGGDVNSAQDVSAFLRNLINPIAVETGVAPIFSHHLPKPPRTTRDKNAYMASDYAYAGAGSAEMSNWARAIISLHEIEEQLFEFRASKRGERSGLLDDQADPAFPNPIYLQHSTHGICWERALAPISDVSIDNALCASFGPAIPPTGASYAELMKIITDVRGCTKSSAESFFRRNGRKFSRESNHRYFPVFCK